MYKVIFFEDEHTLRLQEKINEWLFANRDITIFQTNIGCAPLNRNGDKCVFYILYTTTEAQVAELKELAKEAVPGEVVEASEINPDIMKADSIYNQ